MPLFPQVTVFIPAFNAERYIRETIESVLHQTYKDFELLIIDDGSTDATPEIIAEYSTDSRLHIVTHAKNIGRPATRNEGLDLAQGKYIAFLDADDLCVPDRLERQLKYLETHPRISGVHSWMTSIDPAGKSHAISQHYKAPLDPDMIACRLLASCSIQQGALMIRTSAISPYRYDQDFPVSQDYELWSRMIATCRFACLPLPLTLYRRHQAQASTARISEQNALARIVRGRQITALGISFTEIDLIRHECFLNCDGNNAILKKTGEALNIDYLRWCRSWLKLLLSSNAKTQNYPEPAFSHMLIRCWFFACKKATRNNPKRLVLREAIIPSMRHKIASFFIYTVGRKIRILFRSMIRPTNNPTSL